MIEVLKMRLVLRERVISVFAILVCVGVEQRLNGYVCSIFVNRVT